ncbi:MAG: amino acid ABC transporter permease [Acetatifactor sp.]
MSFHINMFLKSLLGILPYLKTTLLVAAASLLFSTIIGGIAAAGILGKNSIGRVVSKAYIALMRCVPPIVLLFVVYYGSPTLVLWLTGKDINNWDAIYFAIFSLSLLHGASMAELMRAAYQTVEKGQREAAVSIGLSPFQAFYRIVLPQAAVAALPILGNAVVSMLKDGALAYSIGVVDITGRASYIISLNLGGYVLETYLALALIYWILSVVTAKSFQVLGKKLRRG